GQSHRAKAIGAARQHLSSRDGWKMEAVAVHEICGMGFQPMAAARRGSRRRHPIILAEGSVMLRYAEASGCSANRARCFGVPQLSMTAFERYKAEKCCRILGRF